MGPWDQRTGGRGTRGLQDIRTSGQWDNGTGEEGTMGQWDQRTRGPEDEGRGTTGGRGWRAGLGRRNLNENAPFLRLYGYSGLKSRLIQGLPERIQ